MQESSRILPFFIHAPRPTAPLLAAIKETPVGRSGWPWWGKVGRRGGAKWLIRRSGVGRGRRAEWDAAAERHAPLRRSLVAHEKRPPHGEGAGWRVMPK